MNGMCRSARQQRIEAQLGKRRQVWLHKPTNCRAALICELAGLCELESIDGNTMYANRVDLDNPEVWRRVQ
jgi:hypothetical protein